MIKTAKRKERGEGKEKQGEKFRAMGRVIKAEKEEAEKEGKEREQKQIKGNWKKKEKRRCVEVRTCRFQFHISALSVYTTAAVGRKLSISSYR